MSRSGRSIRWYEGGFHVKPQSNNGAEPGKISWAFDSIGLGSRYEQVV